MNELFDHIGKPRFQRVCNVLLESTFFYRDDDADLFAVLRKHRAQFERFFQECFGWELLVDARAARLYKARWINPALKRAQQDVFAPTRRDDCIAFLLVLEFYEHLLEEQNLSVDDAEPPRFAFGQLVSFAAGRMAEILGTADDDGARRQLKGLMPLLLRHRFLREVPPDADERDTIGDDQWLYDALPALHYYDARLLGPRALERALGDDPAAVEEEA